MVANHLEQLDDAQSLNREGNNNVDLVNSPAYAVSDELSKHFTTDEMPFEEALVSAVRLNLEMTRHMVFMGLGELLRRERVKLYPIRAERLAACRRER